MGMRGFVLIAVIGGVLFAAACGPATSNGGGERARCTDVVDDFLRAFPEIIEAAGHPSYECISDPSRGAGGYWKDTNAIQINNALSPEARAWDVTDKRRYLMKAVAHETGHAWAVHNELKQRGQEFQALRDYSALDAADPIIVQEDYAETFAYALGWYQSDDECYAHVPYCWQLDAGKPTAAQINALRAVGLLPLPR